MEIYISKNIVRNNGYNLRAYDLIMYVKLLLLSEKTNCNTILLDHSVFKNSIMVNDNRTLKKSLNTLYQHGLIKDEYKTLPSKKGLSVTVNKIISNEVIKISHDIFKYISELKHIGLQILFYLKTYEDDLNNDYTNLIEYDTIAERLMLNKDTITTHMKYIKANKEYSYLTDKTIFTGDKRYKETDYLPPKRAAYNTKNLELKLEKELMKQLELIEHGMKYIDRQVEVKDGRIDILARDKNNTLCIIELKVVTNEERLIFQCVYYPTQFDEPVRMITIAPDYESKIKISLEALDVEMKTYSYYQDKLFINQC